MGSIPCVLCTIPDAFLITDGRHGHANKTINRHDLLSIMTTDIIREGIVQCDGIYLKLTKEFSIHRHKLKEILESTETIPFSVPDQKIMDDFVRFVYNYVGPSAGKTNSRQK